MFLEIITPDKKIYSGEITSVQVPGTLGLFQVLEDHAAIISTLKKGNVKVADKQGTRTFPIQSGVIEVLKNNVIVLAESAQ
jgi:F-type H+-transporting ATPase subunit epsilon